MHDTVSVPVPVPVPVSVSREHAHDHDHAQGGPHAHSHDGSHGHSHDAPHAPEQAPENVDNLILDIGADTGALVIHAAVNRDQAEIEISPAGGGRARTHNIVRRREAVSGAVYEIGRAHV